ncbi:carnitine O-palmitoyltransferase 2, mitochondrial-like isoform X1 [Ornithorhynchus anatinus]|uniref:Choline/carnitine acyltransferase domain-containing protein n=1 Tax=Ornithorhynchus anatinus TaxID=9258 RepID=F7GCD2_ORNAN|nr:carnitine O-palmitoyltransferase 2, mitochondrial-like isoform X1 [Ornithorhynchus anatinus]
MLRWPPWGRPARPGRGRPVPGWRPYWRSAEHGEALTLAASTWDRDHHYVHRSLIPTLHFQESLPRLPIPHLGDTIRRYMAAQKPLLDDEEYRYTEKIAMDFEKGIGKQLQKDLIELDKKNSHTSYISDPWFDMYLSARDPIVLNFNPFIILKRDPQESYNNQIVRATNLIVSATKFRNSLLSNFLEPDIYYVNPKWSKSKTLKRFLRFLPTSMSWYGAYLANAFPLDMSQYVHLFNSSRVPKQNRDQLFSDQGARHLLVMRKGHFYIFDILDPIGNILHPYEIQAHLVNIMQDGVQVPEYPLGYLTTENRNTWAVIREQLLEAGNEESLNKIDSALFCLCLDDISTQNHVELSHCMLHGYGYNRWFDKSFSLIVTGDGSAGINFEHSWGDGIAVLRFINEVYRDSTRHPSIVPQSRSPTLGSPNVERLEFNLNHSIRSAVDAARQKFKEKKDVMSVKGLEYRKFGRKYVIEQRMSPDAIFQLACQVAVFRLYGKTVASYEACSTAGFKRGRTETIRPTSIYTKRCAQAFINGRRKYSVQELRQLIENSSKYHKFLQMEASLGRGFDRHLFALRYLVESRGEPVPEFFLDSAYQKINYNIISTSTLSSSAIFLGGFGPVVPDGFGIGYTITESSIGCNIISYLERDADEFLEFLEGSLNDFFDVFEGKTLV